ncbi:hypothetical protein L9F63_012046 [Diploptera punctata]|uniref:Dynein regulatory complex subunit 2 n=1 Tax=Diploptera punctata TaxID=6984 RepID=A0AAD8ENR1_DIPPU|nr:hypothetical protein L9F63_012046 [Diploptera punctata]
MAPKKKGKGSKLARMTEEERARYLQHRAAIEEEARRRKQQLIATFMKNKLKHEEAFTRLNLAKINQQWRHILRQIKSRELKQELEYVWHLFEHITDRKNQIIESLLNELEESEEQYARNLRSHAETIDQLIELHAKRVEQLHNSYITERNKLLTQARKEHFKITSIAVTEEETLQTLLFQMRCNMDNWTSKWQNIHLTKVDEVRNEMLSNTDTLQTISESKLEILWKEFQAILQDYMTSTETKRSQYTKLKARDEISSNIIAKHNKIINSFTDTITNLKYQVVTLRTSELEKINDLKAQRAYYIQLFWSLRKQLVNNKKHDENQLKIMTSASNAAIKEMELVVEKGGRILQLASMCRRMETEREKVLPFVTCPDASQMFTQKEKDNLEITYKEIPKEPLAKEIQNYLKMDNFWKRYNRAYLERAALSLHREALLMENQQLTRALQQYLTTLALGAEHPPTQPSLTVARPVSSHVVREHINLIPSEDNEKFRNKKRSRPVTCIEANNSIAVRHMLHPRIF